MNEKNFNNNSCSIDVDESSIAMYLHENSCLLVKNAFDVKELIDIGRQAKGLFETYSKYNVQEEVPDGVVFSTKQKMANITMLEPDKENMKYEILMKIRKSKLWKILIEYFKSEKISCLLPICDLRIIDPLHPEIGIPFHQDGFALEEKESLDMLSMWFLIEPEECGNYAPNVELISGKFNKNYKLVGEGEGNTYSHASLDPAIINELLENGNKKYAHLVNRGDVLLFNRYNIHRTRVIEEHTEKRISMELRFLAWNKDTEELFKLQKNPLVNFDRKKMFYPKKINWEDRIFLMKQKNIYNLKERISKIF